MSAEQAVLPPDSDGAAAAARRPGPGAHENGPRARVQVQPDVECSVGVMAYNEEANIAHALDSILRQDPAGKRITEVIVVASGCEDRTAAIVTDIAGREPRVRLIEQARREGKASAINLFIGAAQCPVLVMVSADVIVRGRRVRSAAAAFRRTRPWAWSGGHPTPVNGAGTFLGHAVHLQWRLHDRIARDAPKLGEMVAFRNVVPSIPLDTAVDELSIQALISAARIPAGVRAAGGGLQPRPLHGAGLPAPAAPDLRRSPAHS